MYYRIEFFFLKYYNKIILNLYIIIAKEHKKNIYNTPKCFQFIWGRNKAQGISTFQINTVSLRKLWFYCKYLVLVTLHEQL